MMKPIRNVFETYKLYIILDERRMNIETWLEFLEVFIYTLEQGKEIKSIILTLALMLIYSCIYVVVRNISSAYIELRTPRVEAYIQNLLHKKASEVELACFENSDFYDFYIEKHTTTCYTLSKQS